MLPRGKGTDICKLTRHNQLTVLCTIRVERMLKVVSVASRTVMNKGIGHLRSNDYVIMLNEITALLILKTVLLNSKFCTKFTPR